jgi:AraC-like DNA-binding protein
VVVLHPDEPHDGRAGVAGGFGYRIVYVAPAHIAEAIRAIRGRPAALPFVREPVLATTPLAAAIEAAFRDAEEPLAVDSIVLRLTEGLLDAAASAPAELPPVRIDEVALARARQYLDAEVTRVVQSSELETVSGLNRYDLARQFRAAVGTSPYRYSLLRRLDRARGQLRENPSLADLALASGFADQAHFTRMFKAAVGVTPARYRRLAGDHT